MRTLLLTGSVVLLAAVTHWSAVSLLGLRGRWMWGVYAIDALLGLVAAHFLSLIPHGGSPATLTVEDGVLRVVPHGLLAGRVASVAVQEIEALLVDDTTGLTRVGLVGGGMWRRRILTRHFPGGMTGLLEEIHQLNPDVELRHTHTIWPLP